MYAPATALAFDAVQLRIAINRRYKINRALRIAVKAMAIAASLAMILMHLQ